MLSRLRSVFLYDIPVSFDTSGIKSQIMEENRKFAVIWSIAQILYWSFCLFMTTRNDDYYTCRHIYAVALSICLVTLMLALFTAQKVSWLIKPIAIELDVAFLGAGIGVALNLAPKTIIIFASVLVVPVFFISDTLSTLLLLTINAVVFAIVGKFNMEPDTYSWTLANLIIFSTIGLTLSFFCQQGQV